VAPAPPPKGKGADNNGDANGVVVDDPHAVVAAFSGDDQSKPTAPKH
jgi:hypothetical protein